MITAALAVALRERRLRVGVMKPVETGCRREDGRLIPEDALFLLQASGSSAPLDLVNPYALSEPLAPALAMERQGVQLELERIHACYSELAGGHDVVLVEGAGGLLVPLADRLTMLDLAADLRLPLLIVARNALGVINHASLTVAVARRRGVPVLGIVLNHPTPEQDLTTQTNAEALRRWAGASLLAEIPYMSTLQTDILKDHGERLLHALGERFPLVL